MSFLVGKHIWASYLRLQKNQARGKDTGGGRNQLLKGDGSNIFSNFSRLPKFPYCFQEGSHTASLLTQQGRIEGVGEVCESMGSKTVKQDNQGYQRFAKLAIY